MSDITVKYDNDGIESETSNVWVDWPDGFCWLVCNEYGVIGAVITMNDGESGWHEAYEAAVDEIAHDYEVEDEAEFNEANNDGLCQFRGSGVPSNKRLKTGIADTQYLTVIKNERSIQRCH